MNNHLRGERRICPFCELKFYDLNRSKLECPRCKNEIIIEDLIKKPIASQKTNLKEKLIEKSNVEEVEDENIDNEMETEDDTSTIVNIDE